MGVWDELFYSNGIRWWNPATGQMKDTETGVRVEQLKARFWTHSSHFSHNYAEIYEKPVPVKDMFYVNEFRTDGPGYRKGSRGNAFG